MSRKCDLLLPALGLQVHKAETVNEPITPASHPVFADGQLVADRYRIVRFLNRGGMGEVYEAKDLELNERVALKTLLPEIAGDAQMIARFKQEIQLSRKISHANVCRIFDLARDPVDVSSTPTYFLTMEFLPGETLAACLRRKGRFSPAEALALLAQMADALDAAHQNGVIHRDLKPANVMLVPIAGGTRAVVTDFGLARRTLGPDETTATLTGKLMGTVDYMAPELFAGAAASPASDIYALALVAYKMITGELPKASGAPWQAAAGRANQRIPSAGSQIPNLDASWDRALSRALDPYPARRFQTAGDFIKVLRGETAPATVTLATVTRRQWVAALVVTLALVSGLAAWRVWRKMAVRPPPEALSLHRTGIDDIHAGAYFAATRALSEATRLAPHFSLAHARLAEAWMGLDLQEKAQEEMVRAQREDIAGLPEIDRLQIAAISLTITREFDAAVQKYELIARMAGTGDAGAALDLGHAYARSGKPDAAIQLFRRAAEGPAHSPAAWLWLGILYARRADAAKSTQAFDQAERLYQITSNLEGLIEVAYQRGIAAYRTGQLEASAAYYRKALETAHNAGNIQQEIRARLQLSTNAYLSGDAGMAEQYAREALEAAQTNQMESQAISGIVNLGNACLQKRDFECAERNYQDALARARRNGSGRMAALALISLASLHYDNDRYDAAAGEARQALTYYQANRFAEESLKALTILGRADYHRGHDADALGSFRSLLDLAEKSQNRPQMALAHENLGLVYSRQQRYPEALAEYRKNLELSTDAVHTAYAQLQCGDMFWMLGNYNEGESMLAQAGAIAAKIPRLKLSIMRARAKMALSRSQYAQAAAQARLALAAGTVSPGTEADLKAVEGLALLGSGRKEAGLRLCEEALRAVESLHDDELLLNVRLAVVKARLESAHPAAALVLFHQAEPALSSFPEWRWRFLALASTADRLYLAPARQALEQLAAQWGAGVFESYLERPDVKHLAQPLLSSPKAER